MVATRRRDTAPELQLRSALHSAGLRFRVDEIPIRGLRCRADVVFRSARVAVFVNGCFWHGCPEHATWPKHNAEWWRKKIEGNRARDERVDETLRAAGWIVMRVWEHDDVRDAARAIEQIVRSRRRRPGTSPERSSAR